jgi:hypothetical protein
MNWKVASTVTIGLFGVGVAVGYAANKRGVPQDQVGRWMLKGITRRALRLADATRELVPDDTPERITDALINPPTSTGVS